MNRSFQTIEGVLEQVGSASGDVLVRVGGRVIGFDVPSECPVLLLGEQVKLRLLQPRDRIQVTFTDGEQAPVAACIRALWQLPWIG